MMFDSIYVGIVLSFFIAVMVTFIFTTSRTTFKTIKEEELKNITPVMTLSSMLFALLTTFTISNLWRRYQDIRKDLITQLNKLRFLYRAVKSMPKTEEIQKTIKLYANSLATTELKSLAKEKHSSYTEELYDQLVDDVLKYNNIYEPKNRFVVFGNLYTGEEGEQLVTSEINHALYLIILITAILTLGAFWFLNIVDFQVQFIIDLFIITIVGLVLYLIHELMNPFDSNLLKGSFTCIYEDFLKVLDEELPNV